MQVIWQEDAVEELRKVLRYGQENFGLRMVERFYDQLSRCETLLASNPAMGSIESLLAHRKATYRSLVVHKHYKLVYWVDEKKDVIYISDLWDTRREPAALAERI